MKKNTKVKKGTLKDWIEVFILVVIVVVISFYLCSWYNNYKHEKMNDFILKDDITQIKYEELNPYLQENNDAYVYICVIDDNDCREFEMSIKEDLEKNNLKDYIVYLNLTNEKNKMDIIKKINKDYAGDKKIDNYPAFVRIKNGKIVSMVEKVNKKLTKNKFSKYIDLNEIN